MTNSLIEKITKVVMATRYGAPELIAKEVVAAVADWLSDENCPLNTQWEEERDSAVADETVGNVIMLLREEAAK